MAKHKQKSYNTPPQLSYPAISAIIPLYNAEKYLSECLDSLLAQTFQNFEVIVVDDCSTDSSCAIVESYKEKFGGRLNLLRMIKNSGSGTEPRNLGLTYSRGEYLYFMDNDDTITPTAFEELYTLAKKYDADVVHCEKNYEIPEEFYYDPEYTKKHKPSCYPAKDKIFITVPTLLTDDFAKRAVEFSRNWLTWSIWIQLIRREFVVKNKLQFVGVVIDDKLFTICEICSAKRYLVVPNVIYKHRVRSDSLLWQDLSDVQKFIHSRLLMLKEGINYLNKYLDNIETFSHRPDLKYVMFDMFSQEIAGHLNKVYTKISAPVLDELIRKEFSDGNNLALTSYIFNVMNVQRVQFMQAQYQFNQFAQQAQKRIAELEAENKRLKQKG